MACRQTKSSTTRSATCADRQFAVTRLNVYHLFVVAPYRYRSFQCWTKFWALPTPSAATVSTAAVLKKMVPKPNWQRWGLGRRSSHPRAHRKSYGTNILRHPGSDCGIYSSVSRLLIHSFVHQQWVGWHCNPNRKKTVGHRMMLALGSVGGAVHVSHKLATRKIKSSAEHFFDEGKVCAII